MYEIIDNNGVIHSGGEDEMNIAFEVMTSNDLGDIDIEHKGENWEELSRKYSCDWEGDLKLIQIIKRYR